MLSVRSLHSSLFSSRCLATPSFHAGFASKPTINVPPALMNIGAQVFEPKKMLKGHALKAYQDAIHKGVPLSPKARDEITLAMQTWAMDKGAVNFSHWFSAMRGTNAEKHDSMIDLNYATGDIKVEFNSSRLFQGETDGSSFPNGGLRTTHRAAAYTGWDMTSPPFVRGDTLFVPSAFITYNGDPLDDKTPLLRSQEAVSNESVRLLHLLGYKDVKQVISNVGWEQEFFVIDREMYQRRPDLVSCGRTLLGAVPHRGQQTEAHYFARPPLRIRAFLRDVQAELWSLGLSLNTYHNEVAPSQHELSPIFSMSSRAADLNTLAIEVMNEKAARHGLTVLTHEKPFAKINGSGKHNNWGLNTDTGANLFVPGKNAEEQRRFVTFVTALARTINVHGDLLRVGVATAGNDHRLGAQEAPPAIISLYTGEVLEQHLRGVTLGKPLEGYTKDSRTLEFGTRAVQSVQAAKEDRNRTAPFPFCGNRFEFRAVGAHQNIAFPLSLLNTAMADSLGELSSLIEKGKSPRDAVAQMLTENFRCIFNGNGYSEEWQQEASKRGLFNLKTTPEAIPRLTDAKNIALLNKYSIFNETTVHARQSMMYHDYIETILIEVNTLLEMMYASIIPACLKDQAEMGKIPQPSAAVSGFINRKKALTDEIIKQTDELKAANEAFPENASAAEQALYCRDTLKKLMTSVRSVTDETERLITHTLWPFPKYDEILYTHHPEADVSAKSV